MSRRTLLLAAAFMAAAALSGCNVLPAEAPQAQFHDFGPLPAAADDPVGQLRVDRVSAPPWIDDGAIHYRLTYKDPTSLLSYADNRWAAAPSDMLGLRLADLVAGATQPAGSGEPVHLLSVELMEFEQDFSSAQQAEVTLVAEVSIRRAVDGKVLRQKQFVLSAPTTPDVRGAVADLSKLAGQAAEEIVSWCNTAAVSPQPARP